MYVGDVGGGMYAYIEVYVYIYIDVLFVYMYMYIYILCMCITYMLHALHLKNCPIVGNAAA